MAKAIKPTKQQLAQAKLRAAASGIKMDQSAKGLRNAGKAIAAGAALLPAGRGVKAVATAAKAVKAAKSAKAAKSSRQAYDYPVSGKSANQVIPNVGKAKAEYRYGKDMDISKNVKIKNSISPSGRTTSRGGVLQVERQNLRDVAPISKAEAKANARGLKAANKPTNKTGSAMNKRERKYFQGKDEMIKSMQNTERAGLSKSSRKTTKKK